MPLRRTLLPTRLALLGLTAFWALASRPAGELWAQTPTAIGSIRGTLSDVEGGNPVSGALVRLQELGRTELSHGDGSFHFERIRAGAYTVVVERIGYARLQVPVTVIEGRTSELSLALVPSAISIQGLVVTGVGRPRGVEEAYRPTSVLHGTELERNLTASLAATLEREPGLALRSFGPAAAQPVIRGMSGDRVVILEDGRRTGDMASTSGDHAVGIDPLGAERIEVVRGPAGLLYGSNALGGVINVIREEVPHTLPDRVTGAVATQAESVNRGIAGGAQMTGPLAGRVALRVEGGFRTSGDIRTPLGVLEGTETTGLGAALGASWIPEWGYLGASVRHYALDHGVPGQFQGEIIPGAHPGGVEAETVRRAFRVEVGHLSGLGPFSALEADAGVVHYVHEEIEARLPDGQGGTRPVVGSTFDQLSASARLSARHVHEAGGFRTEGALGLSGGWSDLLAGGRFPGLRSATEANLAAFAFEEARRGSLRLQVGARFDWTSVEPASGRPVQTGGTPRPVGRRTFGDLSASLATLWEFKGGWILGAGVARAFRTPSIRELFSDGPHLADFTFDIGNPDLQSETGLGADLFLRVVRPTLRLEASLFRNALENYIYHAPTGALDPRFQRFPVFEARGADALFEGVDGRIQWEPRSSLVLDATLGWVRATRRNGNDPLPAIPPLQASLEARWETPGFFLEGGVETHARQERVPSPIPDPSDPGRRILLERPTPGSTVLNAGAGTTWRMAGGDHSVVLQLRNLGDRVRRDHLSRVKDVAPEPGRNVQLLYRVRF